MPYMETNQIDNALELNSQLTKNFKSGNGNFVMGKLKAVFDNKIRSSHCILSGIHALYIS